MGTLGLDSRGIVSLRAQLGWLQYSRKTETFWVNNGFGLFELESETKSGVFTLGAGPQIMAPTGNARPYVAGTIGLARFSTLRSWLSQWSYDDSHADGLKCAARVSVPQAPAGSAPGDWTWIMEEAAR